MKTRLFLVLFLYCFAFRLMAQAPSSEQGGGASDFPKKTTLKFSPFHFFDNSLQLGIETFLGPENKKSLVFLPVLYYQDNNSQKQTGGALEIQYRIYPKGFKQYKQAAFRRARGIYLAPSLTGGYSTIDKFNQDYTSSRSTTDYFKSDHYECTWIMPALAFGFQFTLWEIGYIDLNLGGGIKINDVKHDQFASPFSNSYINYEGDPSPFDRNYKGLIPRISVTLGVGL